MSNQHRQERLAGLLLEELRIIVSGELDDPNLAMVDVTDVVVSKDLRNVKVYVSYQDDEVSRGFIVQRLQKATPFIRSQIAKRLTLRAVPELLFLYDDTPEKAVKLNDLFKQIADERQQSTQSE